MRCFGYLRTGAPWRDLPPDYGDWKNTHRRFCRWRDKGIWEALRQKLIGDPDFEWIMIDSPCQSASSCSGGERRQSSDGGHKRGVNSKIHLAVDAHGMPLRILLTEGTTSDCTQASDLAKNLSSFLAPVQIRCMAFDNTI